MKKHTEQKSSWGVPIAVDWGKDEKPQEPKAIPADAHSTRPVTEAVVLGGKGNTVIANRVTKQNHI